MREERLFPRELEPGDIVKLANEKTPAIVLEVSEPFGGDRWRLQLGYSSGAQALRTVKSTTRLHVLDPESDGNDPFLPKLLRARIERLEALLAKVRELPPYTETKSTS